MGNQFVCTFEKNLRLLCATWKPRGRGVLPTCYRHVAACDELTVKTAPMEQAQQAQSDATSKLYDELIKTVFEVN